MHLWDWDWDWDLRFGVQEEVSVFYLMLHMLSSGFVTASVAGTCRHPPPFFRRVNRMIFPSFICVGSIVWVP